MPPTLVDCSTRTMRFKDARSWSRYVEIGAVDAVSTRERDSWTLTLVGMQPLEPLLALCADHGQESPIWPGRVGSIEAPDRWAGTAPHGPPARRSESLLAGTRDPCEPPADEPESDSGSRSPRRARL